MKGSVNNSKAFSLMEVNIAVALIGVALLGIFSLFPMGLRESELSVADNHEAMFANHVLSALESNAMHIKNWSDWSDPSTFSNLIRQHVSPVSSVMAQTGLGDGIAFPDTDDSGKVIRYELKILAPGGGAPAAGLDMYLLQLKVKSGRYGDFEKFSNTYLTLVTFMGY